jgi:deoxyribodipyrimidine photo-lyase
MTVLVKKKVVFFWFRRDLRLDDNTGLYHALKSGRPVIPLFIFDKNILNNLSDRRDKRLLFIYNALLEIGKNLKHYSRNLAIYHGKPLDIWQQLLTQYEIEAVYANHDYEPYACRRDSEIESLLMKKGVVFKRYKDQVIFEKDEVLTANGRPYTVYTPYSKRWRNQMHTIPLSNFSVKNLVGHFFNIPHAAFPSLSEIGFKAAFFGFPPKKIDEGLLKTYHLYRDFPALERTSRLGIHLRFGTVSIRDIMRKALKLNDAFLGELIWREFFMQILWHFPQVIHQPFRTIYNKMPWLNDSNDFKRWCNGETGYPLVDAGMRQLNATGFMHNRVRMVTASFLTKNLLIDWRWGENYFAEKLLDFELASNNGNWQWAAGCGCDAAPYFRVFNPEIQQKRFDKDFIYIKKWIPEFGSARYPKPMIEHGFARERYLHLAKAINRDLFLENN